VARHLLAERGRFEARQRRVAGGVHLVRDELPFAEVADVARGAQRRAPGRVPQVGHAVAPLLLRARQLAPAVGLEVRPVQVVPVLVRAVTDGAADAFSLRREVRVTGRGVLDDGAVTGQASVGTGDVVTEQLRHLLAARRGQGARGRGVLVVVGPARVLVAAADVLVVARRRGGVAAGPTAALARGEVVGVQRRP